MEPITVKSKWEYTYLEKQGFQPLIDSRFQIAILLRVEIQREFFGHAIIGRGNIPQANQRFYQFMWKYSPHVCEETGNPIENYNVKCISHIFTRGAHPEMAHDPRNVNILIPIKHTQWEDETARKGMIIYLSNLLRMEKLINEYQTLNL